MNPSKPARSQRPNTNPPSATTPAAAAAAPAEGAGAAAVAAAGAGAGAADAAPTRAFAKGHNDVGRLLRATAYSWQGLRAAWHHEAAFRLEIWLGVPLLALAGWAAPGRWQALALVLSVLAVWIVELLNSAIEALADAVSVAAHPLIGRAKDMASAAVTLSLLALLLTWGVVFWP
jgi:diacylglycerol kinase (ATP)